MNNVADCRVILDTPASDTKKSPFLDVGEEAKHEKNVELFPVKKALPIKIYELKEMDNKLRLYMKGADGELFKLYVGALRSINEILRLEIEKEQKEAEKCRK